MSQIFVLRAGAFQCRPEILAYVANFNFLRKEARGHSAVLVGIHLVLRADGIDLHAFRLVRLQKLYEIIRVSAKVVGANGAASMELLSFIHPGGLHGDANKNKSGFISRARRRIGRM